MNANIESYQRRFLLPLTSVCALCAGLATTALAQDDMMGDDVNSTPAYTDTESGEVDEPLVNVTDYGVIDIAVKEAELAQVLQMLSLQSRKNIISSKNVSATVTANLYDVTFKEALDAILKVNGYMWVEEGNFIYVYTQEEFNQIQDANRQTVGQIFNLDHLSAASAIELITPFLSERGRAAAQGQVESGFVPSDTDGGADGYAYNVRIVVNDYPENIERIAELLDELDTKPDQVMVEATIIQTQMNEDNAFGIDFSVVGSLDFANIVSPLNPVNALINGADPANGFQPADNSARAAQSTVGNTGGPGGLKLGLISDDVSVFLRVLDEVTDNTILAKPKIMALNRQRAEVLVGARVGYLSTTATETTTTQTVEFLDTGVQLVFRPFISKDGTIRMELKPSVSEASLRTVTDSLGASVTIPDELTNEVTTNVRVQDGQTLVLGGLFRENTQVARRQVPVLGDIPILGHAFRGQDDNISRSEIVFLITPTITHDETLWENGEEMLAMGDLVRIGSREGLLWFSREKMTASHNQNAIAARNAGDTELALYHIRNSLRLNPKQPNMIEMQQQLSGEMERFYERSMLERVLSDRVENRESMMIDDTVQINTEDAFETDPLAGSSSSFENTSVNADVYPVSESFDTTTEEPSMADEEWSYINDARETDSWEEFGTDEFSDTYEESSVSLGADNFGGMYGNDSYEAASSDFDSLSSGDVTEVPVSENGTSLEYASTSDDNFSSEQPARSTQYDHNLVNTSWWFAPFAWNYSFDDTSVTEVPTDGSLD